MGDRTPTAHYLGPHDILTTDGKWRTDQEIIEDQQNRAMWNQPILPEPRHDQ